MQKETWTEIGALAFPRSGHSIVLFYDKVLIVGGTTSSKMASTSSSSSFYTSWLSMYSKLPYYSSYTTDPVKTEKCHIHSGGVTCATQEPELTNYNVGPKLF